jgi:hypothetical protein
MSRFIRNTVMLAKIEVTYGTDPVPTGGTSAILVKNVQPTPLNSQNVDRDVITGYMGGFQQLVGNRNVQISFDVELVGSGTAGTAPGWGPLLRACAFAETVTAVTRVDYTPISSGFESVTLYYYDDGLLHKITGARGNVSFKLDAGGVPMMSFTFTGLYNAPTAAANASPTLTGFKVPQVVAEANTGDLTFGATHVTSTAPALTGGTPYPSMGLDFSPNNSVQHVPVLGGESVEITSRAASGSFQVDLTAANEAMFMGTVASATLQSVGLVHGTAAGNNVLVFLPNVQLVNPKKQDSNGKRLIGFDARLVPSAGNDEMRIALF